MDDMPPPWDEALFESPQSNVAPSRALEPVPMQVEAPPAVEEMKAPEPVVVDRTLWHGPVVELGWDGNWPDLAASLPLRGVAQQLAQQSELIHCKQEGNQFIFDLRVPLATLLSAGSADKLCAALSERFSKNIRIETKIGAVELTANAKAIADREVRQKHAEQAIQQDSFVQTLMREFGAVIVTGSVRPV